MDAYLNRKISSLDSRLGELKKANDLLCHFIITKCTLKKGTGLSELNRELDIIKELGKYKSSMDVLE